MRNDRLTQALYRMVELQEQILEEIRLMRGSLGPEQHGSASADLIDEVDVRTMLRISSSTLYRLKRQKLITSIRIGKRDYYSISQLQKSRSIG